MTFGISGLASSICSESADLSFALASRLSTEIRRARGSTECRLTWSHRVTPSGHVVYLLRASEPLTSDTGCTLWPTPHKNAVTGPGSRDGGENIQTVAATASWQTPLTPTGGKTSRSGDRKDELLIAGQAKAATLASPSARDWKDTPGMTTMGTNPDGTERDRNDQLPRQANQVLGIVWNGSSVEIRSEDWYGGQLNPSLVRWLQGVPAIWCAAAIEAHSRWSKGRKRGRSGSKAMVTVSASR